MFTNKPFTTTDVLGVPLFNGTIREAVTHLNAVCRSDSGRLNRCISATGAHGIVLANKNPALMAVLKNFYMNLCDGRPGMWISRLKGNREIQQCPGADFFESVMKTTANTPIKHYFCGGKPDIAKALKKSCAEKFNNYDVVGTYSPPFREMTDPEFQQLAESIKASQADVVWIGISTPKQEIFAAQLAAYIQVHFIITVGAAFDFHSSNLKRAPYLFSYLGIEWLYRLTKEPTRLYKRVLEIIPAYIWLNACELFTYLFAKKKEPS